MYLFSEEEYNSCKWSKHLTIKCDQCNKIYRVGKRKVFEQKNTNTKTHFCSDKCRLSYRRVRYYLVRCKTCEKYVLRTQKNLKKYSNVFCCSSCAARYNNTHKTKGHRRSKLEIWIEKELKIKFPNLTILCNQKNQIQSELDLYIPELKLAIELNGIFHYRPIYGIKKFNKIKTMDLIKTVQCLNQNITLLKIKVPDRDTMQSRLEILQSLLEYFPSYRIKLKTD
jgi:hypothetical protein